MKDIGVDITLSKSVTSSRAVFEFAKVTGFFGKNVSPISWKMFISQNSFMGRANILFSLIPRVQPKRVMYYIDNILKPVGKVYNDSVYGKMALISMYCNKQKLDYYLLLSILLDRKSPFRTVMGANWLERGHRLSCSLGQLIAGQPIEFSKAFLFDYSKEEPWFIWSLFSFIKVTDLNLNKIASNMTTQFLSDFLLPLVPVEKWAIANDKLFSESYGGIDSYLHEIYSTFYIEVRSIFYHQLCELYTPFVNFEKLINENRDVQLLMLRNQQADSVYSFIKILSRIGHPPVKDLKLDSPLKPLKVLSAISLTKKIYEKVQFLGAQID